MASGRSGTGDTTYRRNRALVLANNDVCWLCGHGGARTTDHIISDKAWPRDEHGRRLPGFNDITNLLPAHGTMGNKRTGGINPCPTCGRLCNQSRGAKPASSPRSRKW